MVAQLGPTSLPSGFMNINVTKLNCIMYTDFRSGESLSLANFIYFAQVIPTDMPSHWIIISEKLLTIDSD